ncbi:hypothetical protein ACFW3W_21530, partial [Streptomyces smyrnaeus]
ALEDRPAVVDPVPYNQLRLTGGVDINQDSWPRGVLAEVPAGLGFDVLRVPGAVAEDAARRMRAAGRRVGPVVLGPLGGEFLLECGSAPRWYAPRSQFLLRGTLVLLPPPTVCLPELVGARGWLVPPTHHPADAPAGEGVTTGGALLEPFLDAVKAAEDAENPNCMPGRD